MWKHRLPNLFIRNEPKTGPAWPDGQPQHLALSDMAARLGLSEEGGLHEHLLPPPPGSRLWYPGVSTCPKNSGLLPLALKFRNGLTLPNRWVFKNPRSQRLQAHETDRLKKRFLSLPLSFQTMLPFDPGRVSKCINRAIISSLSVLIKMKGGGLGIHIINTTSGKRSQKKLLNIPSQA